MNAVKNMPATLFAVCAALSMFILASPAPAHAGKRLREATISGAWYPQDATELKEAMLGFLQGANPPPISGRIGALICPHGGYGFSGTVLAAAYKTIRGKGYDRVIILGPSHDGSVGGIAVSSYTHYQTPLGQVEVDKRAQDFLSQSKIFKSNIQAETAEYSIEAQLPFLQITLGKFKIVPLLVGKMTDAQKNEAAAMLSQLMDRGTLLIISTDFTHYGKQHNYLPFEKNVVSSLRQLDNGAIERILAIDPRGLRRYANRTQINICGINALELALRIIPFGYETFPLAYDHSGRMSNRISDTITYASIVFAQPDEWLSEDEQQALFNEARLTAEAGMVTRGSAGVVPPKPVLRSSGKMRNLERPRGAFVAVFQGDEMLALSGDPMPKEPLRLLMHNLAWEAGKTAGESKKNRPPNSKSPDGPIYVEISVISLPERAQPLDLIPGKHGAAINIAGKTATMLPQEARDLGNDRLKFLNALCMRGGLAPDAWRGGQLYLFTAQVFGGEF